VGFGILTLLFFFTVLVCDDTDNMSISDLRALYDASLAVASIQLDDFINVSPVSPAFF
jgi:hypothetical protein